MSKILYSKKFVTSLLINSYRNYTAYQERYGHSLDEDHYQPIDDYYSLRSRKSDGILIGDVETKSCSKNIVDSDYFFNIKIGVFLLLFVLGKKYFRF